MIQIQFRIRPVHSLLDIDLPLIERHLKALQVINQVRVFDDRASDATFITAVVTLSDATKSSLMQLREALLRLSGVTTLVVDEHGEETLVQSISAEELKKYSKASNSAEAG